MCISFIYNATESQNDFQIIIAMNRDVSLDRPTMAAEFWTENIISGLDCHTKREKGGTWFGASKQGKIGLVHNILMAHEPLPNKKGRGNLVTDYLIGTESAFEYLSRVKKDSCKYHPFNLILLEKSENYNWNMFYLTNEMEMSPSLLSKGLYGMSNTILHQPFRKVEYGKEKFEKIILEKNKIEKKEEMIDALFGLMSDKTKMNPDPILTKYGSYFLPGNMLEACSSINIHYPEGNFGTMSTTLLLIDRTGRCDFIERNLKQSVTADCQEWDVLHHIFMLVDTKDLKSSKLLATLKKRKATNSYEI